MGNYWIYYLLGIILLPGLILASWASVKVEYNYKKYKKALSSKGITGAVAVQKVLEQAGVGGVRVFKNLDKGSELNNYYDPNENTITLSSEVYDGCSISALGIAAHEAGHAVQYAKEYKPAKIRKALAKASGITANLLWPLVILGIILNFAYVGGVFGNILLFSGVAVFGLSVIVSLLELPVEFNASKQALSLLVSSGCLDEMEVKGAKKVLTSAALTYVAALVVAVLSLIRFLVFILINSRRD